MADPNSNSAMVARPDRRIVDTGRGVELMLGSVIVGCGKIPATSLPSVVGDIGSRRIRQCAA
jgi:hypothetical protein